MHRVRVHVVQADMGDPSSARTIIDAAISEFSESHAHPGAPKTIDLPTKSPKIDIIINNAGVSYNKHLGDITPEDFHHQYNINVLGPLLLVQAAVSHLPADRSGRIVNLSSVSATQGFEAQSVYGGTKAALDAMTRTWARELNMRATINSVNPGPVDSDMYASTTEYFREKLRPFIEHAPLMQLSKGEMAALSEDDRAMMKAAGGRSAKAEEIAGVVGMLCSAESGWCTGSVVCANGGMVFTH